ncbi:uncharacterized protein LOC118816785 isoform X2 [Colossoma macropomum]|uniref:uncharacterized protein LOC118816785 isoform X2 n=1 Tax=Colossoma macropomum TaxID=42526 RepID=UPI0018643C5E|nr:uncharacterized protein LOC118816785 isoform X2 [Colossoma macropomum]
MFCSLFLTYLFELVYIGASLLFQSPSVTVDVGTNVTLLCDISHAFGQCSSVRWLLYQPVGGLRIYTHLSRGFKAITHEAQRDTQCLLNIPQASLSHSGTFYCLLLNLGVDYMGNGTELTVMDTTDKAKVNEDHRMISEQVFGGVSLLLLILTIIAVCSWQRRGITHQRNSNATGKHQQSSSETQYATLKFGPRRQEGITHSCT